MTLTKRTKDAIYYAENKVGIRARKVRLMLGGFCVNHPSRLRVSRTKCHECLLSTRLSGLRMKGLPDYEVDKARRAIAAFNGRCQCCGVTEPGGKGEFHLDHDDVTKKFRGILCAACNLAIGHAQESIERLQRMIQYLRYAAHGILRRDLCE